MASLALGRFVLRDKFPPAKARLLLASLAVALPLAGGPAKATGLQSHSVAFDAKPAGTGEKNLFVEGQGSVTLTRRCDGWALGEVFQLVTERGAASAPLRASDKADRLEERINAQESLDGGTLTYKSQLRQNGRLLTATGKATLGAEPGKIMADLGRYKQDSDLPAGTLAPAAARAALLDALVASKPGKIEIRTVELLRFHKPIAEAFIPLPPTDLAIARDLPKELHASDKNFSAGHTWAVLRRVPDFNEFGDELWLVHQSGAIVRQMIQRQGVKLLLEAREVTLFPPPTCN
jgi:hypothetical protein